MEAKVGLMAKTRDNRKEEDSKLREIRQEAHEKREHLHEVAEEPVKVLGHPMVKADVFKVVGLLAFIVVMCVAAYLAWPYIRELFEPGGVQRVIEDVRNAGPAGVLILLAMQFLQIVVVFIPGEVTQVAAGMLYGPWLGALIILAGCLVSSAFIFQVVSRLGAPFVKAMVSEKHLSKIERFEESNKFETIVFILFLIPGLPKDVFTYLVPLTKMRLGTFLFLTTLGRVPGVIVSTYSADGLVDGRIVQSILLFVVVGIIAVLGIVFNDRIIAFIDEHFRHKGSDEDK